MEPPLAVAGYIALPAACAGFYTESTMPDEAPHYRSRLKRRKPPKSHGWDHSKTTTQRGYGHAWRKKRKAILQRDRNLCQAHLRRGIYREGKEVDHIRARALGGTDDDSNLETLCDDCHKAKTAEDNRKIRLQNP